MSRTIRVLAIASVLTLPEVAGAQSVQVKTIGKPEVEYSEPFTALAGARELKDGRVVTVDPRDKTVQVIDLKTQSALKVGREGSGPGEYGLPMTLLALPADSSAVPDPLNSRLLVVLPDGKVGGFIMTSGGGGGGFRMGALPRKSDGRGNLYWATPGVTLPSGDGPPKISDSAAVIRWNYGAKKTDTVALLALPKGSSQVSGGRGNVNVQIGGGNPFTARDEWAVAPDGRVAVLRAGDYHVEWISPNGQKTVGAPIKYERLKVTEAHRAEWREGRKNSIGIMMRNENGRMSAQAVPGGGAGAPEPTDWPEYLPPFLGDPAQVAPNGQLWVRRTAPAGAPPTYDVIDAAGKLVNHVVLPKKTRLVAFGNGVVYLVRMDDDDLQYLGRYRL
jgi:hypothetical protein